MHNDEAAYMRSLAQSEHRLWKRLFFYGESIRFKRYAPRVWKTADRIWPISTKECHSLINAQTGLQRKLRWLPPTLLPTRDDIGRKPEPGRVLFIGNLRGPINQDALHWYLDHVHPHLLDRPDYQLTVAGNTIARGRTDTGLEILDRIEKTERCTLFANVPSLSHLYSESSVLINPMQRGAGVKLKTVQAAAAGIPIVSTLVGNDGTGLLPNEHIRIAESAGEFVNAIEELLSDPGAAENMADAAANFVTNSYSPNVLEQLILDATTLDKGA
jgi:glycosyltransferase involved in cell wall biosynthesis